MNITMNSVGMTRLLTDDIIADLACVVSAETSGSVALGVIIGSKTQKHTI